MNPGSILVSLLTFWLALVGAAIAPSPSPARTEWSFDAYADGAARYQNPDPTACTAASVLMALNMIGIEGQAGSFGWTNTTDFAAEEAILHFEQAHDTLPGGEGSDPHGVRNALNYFGWGDVNARIYADRAYGSFADASKAIVTSIARTHDPTVIFPWYGGHAQVVTGYTATGENPATSDNFTVTGVYLTDPAISVGTLISGTVVQTVQPIARNSLISQNAWHRGDLNARFTQYWQKDSILRDDIDGRVGWSEWYGKWVAVLAG
jgi:hypothetical protein